MSLLKNFQNLLKYALLSSTVATGTPIEIWFQDEARVGQQGTLTRIWDRRGTRPRAPRDQHYKWAYLFGAICPDRGTGAALVLPYADTNAMNLHLEEISRCVAPGSHAVVILDGAGYHKSEDLAIPNNISLLRLPPYYPELNSHENIWQYLRQNKLSITVWDNYNDIVECCYNAWNWLMELPEVIATIGSREWAKTVIV